MNFNNYVDIDRRTLLSTVTRFTEGLLNNNFNDLLGTRNSLDYFPRR
jgi:hypothetical protein